MLNEWYHLTKDMDYEQSGKVCEVAIRCLVLL